MPTPCCSGERSPTTYRSVSNVHCHARNAPIGSGKCSTSWDCSVVRTIIPGSCPAACSSGCKLRALALRPAVMLMDEPFAALDAMTKASLQDELLRLRDQTKTSFVFITHDIEEATYVGALVAVVNGSAGGTER